MKFHQDVQDTNSDGDVEYFCETCGKDWVYYNDKLYWLRLKVWLHNKSFGLLFK